MKFAEQLKEQLTDFVESYQKYFLKTFTVAMTFTVMCLVVSAVLIRIDTSDSGMKIDNLVGLMFIRYSYKSYQFIDFSRICSFFFISIFALLLLRFDDEDTGRIREFTFNKFVSKITGEDILALSAAMITACFIDFFLFNIYKAISPHVYDALNTYLYYIDIHLRWFVPMLLYVLTIRWITNSKRLTVTYKDILFMFLVMWIFDCLTFEFFIWIRDFVLNLLLLHFAKSELLVLYESLFSIPIMGFYFVGFYSAMTWWLRVGNEEVPADIQQEFIA